MDRRLYPLCFLPAFAALAAGAAIYKWVDPQGETHYSGSPPDGVRAHRLELPPGPPEEALERAQRRRRSHLREERRRHAPQTVLGTLEIRFSARETALLPEPPIGLALSVKRPGRARPRRHELADPGPEWVLEMSNGTRVAHGDYHFSFELPPGSYRIVGLEIESQGLADDPVEMLVPGPDFVVPEGACVYIGRIGYSFYLIPPGSPGQTVEMVRGMAVRGHRPFLLRYLQRGAIALGGVSAEQSAKGEGGGDTAVMEEARLRGCRTDLARFPSSTTR